LDDALAAAWRAYDADPEEGRTRRLIAGLMHERVLAVPPERDAVIARLLADDDIDPDSVAPTGWLCLKRDAALFGDAADLAVVAQRLEASVLAHRLLREALVFDHAVETRLTALRRWLLLSGRWPEFPETLASLVAQAAHNGGAWLLDDEERRRLEALG